MNILIVKHTDTIVCDSTALHLTVMARNEELFALLLARAAVQPVDLNLRTIEGHTPLWFALIRTTASQLYNCNSFAARLVEKGAIANPVRIYQSLYTFPICFQVD